MVREGFIETEMGIVPYEWFVTTLGQIGKPKMCKRILKEQTTDQGEIPFFKIGTFGKSPDAYISRELFERYRSKFSYPKVGDILLSAAGTIGRTVVFDGKDAYFQDSNIVWIDNNQKNVLNEYLYYLYSVIIWRTAYGGTVSRLYNGLLKSTVIVYPSLEEQRAIAGALSDVDKLITNLEKLITKKKAIKQGAMQELLTGKKRLSGFCKKWKKEKLSKFASTASGGTPSRSNSTFYNGDIRWVTTSELNDCRIQDTNEHITLEAIRCSSAKIFPAGTLLMAMYGATIGKLGIIEQDSATNQACCAIMPNSEVLVSYLYYWLLLHRKEIVELGCGAGQPNISQQIVKNLIITYPEVSEQQCIVNVLMDIDVELKKLDKTLIKYRQIKQGMMQKLLTGDIRLV